MNPRLVVQPQAERDIREHAAFIAADSPDAAHRFVEAARAEFRRLAEMPGMGRMREFRRPSLAGVRSWRIKGFKKHLVFYRRIEEGIEVLRVLHGARDIPRVLGETDEQLPEQ